MSDRHNPLKQIGFQNSFGMQKPLWDVLSRFSSFVQYFLSCLCSWLSPEMTIFLSKVCSFSVSQSKLLTLTKLFVYGIIYSFRQSPPRTRRKNFHSSFGERHEPFALGVHWKTALQASTHMHRVPSLPCDCLPGSS